MTSSTPIPADFVYFLCENINLSRAKELALIRNKLTDLLKRIKQLQPISVDDVQKVIELYNQQFDLPVHIDGELDGDENDITELKDPVEAKPLYHLRGHEFVANKVTEKTVRVENKPKRDRIPPIAPTAEQFKQVIESLKLQTRDPTTYTDQELSNIYDGIKELCKFDQPAFCRSHRIHYSSFTVWRQLIEDKQDASTNRRVTRSSNKLRYLITEWRTNLLK